MNEVRKLLKEKTRVISLGKYKEAAEVCNAIGNEYVSQERYEEALEQHLEELEYCELTGDQLGIAVANRKIGESYAHLNNFKKALHHVRKYYDISVRLTSHIEKQRAYSTFGRTYYLKHQYEIVSGISDSKSKTLDQAELAYCRAFELLPKLVSEIKPVELAEMKCRLLLNWGLVNENRGEYELSINRVKQGLEIALKHHLYEDIQRCGLALGTVYQKVGNYPAADKAYEEALSSAKKLSSHNMICEILLSKATNFIAQENFEGAKKCLKSGYKLRTSNIDDHEKIAKTLKVCIGICNAKSKLKTSRSYKDRKLLLETIADGLASINCFKLAIEKYLLTVECMEEANATRSEKAPIYFSLAQSYFDDDNIPKALEYYEKEFTCNDEKPLEQVKTLWEIADVLEQSASSSTDKMEEVYLKAVSIVEKTGKEKILHDSLRKLYSFYENTNKSEEAKKVKKKLDNIRFECESDDEEEESEDLFADIDLNDLSDSDNNEEITPTRRRIKKIGTRVNDVGETPLHQACINGNYTVVKRLLENGHPVNIRDNCGWTPLHEAANHGFYDLVEYLLEKGANINDPGGSQCRGTTPLHDAASCGHFDIIALLISKGASVTAVNRDGETPLQALIEWKQRVSDLDDVTLRQCIRLEEDLKIKMKEAGMVVNESNLISNNIHGQKELDMNFNKSKSGEKRARSPSLSPDIVSDDEDYETEPHSLNINCNEDWDDANNAKDQYRSVMENLRRSAAAILPAKTPPSNDMSGPALVNANEVVDEWLIKDTKEMPKAKRKRRKFSRLNVRTSKCIDNYLVSQDLSENVETGRNRIVLADEDSNVSISSVNSTDKNMETSPSQAVRSENARLSFCLRVHIADKLILVPVPNDSSTISWLSEEAACRFQSLDGRKPYLTLTKNGALLAESDLIKNIFSNNDEVMSSVEAWDEPSLEDRYVQLCAKRNTIISSSIRKRFQFFESSSELNISNCSIPSLHMNIIFLALSNFKSLLQLNISGTPINGSNMSELVSCIPSFSTLQTFNMSCCCLTSDCLKKFTDYLTRTESMLPSLKSLDLSFNNFSSNSSFLPLLNLNSLISLNLSSCGLTSSIFSNQALCKILESKHSIEDFDISGNFLGESGISEFLCCLPKLSLKKLDLKHTLKENSHLGSKLFSFLSDLLPFLTELNLQSCYLTDSDIKQISLCLDHCPQLQKCDLSANISLSQDSLANLIKRAYEKSLNFIDLNITGTCVWQDEHYTIITDFFRFKNIKHLCIDNCSDSLVENIMESWKNKWGNRAVCLNYGFCELSII